MLASDLGFRFFHLLVIVSLQLHQWAEYVLVVVPIFINLEHWIDLDRIEQNQLAPYIDQQPRTSSSTAGRSRSSSVASGLDFQSSSSFAILAPEICRARNCSCSEGTFTSQERKDLFWMIGSHTLRSHISFSAPIPRQFLQRRTTTESDFAYRKKMSGRHFC